MIRAHRTKKLNICECGIVLGFCRSGQNLILMYVLIAVNYNLLFDTTLSVTSIYVVTYAHIDRAK